MSGYTQPETAVGVLACLQEADVDDICMSMEQLLRKGDRYQAPHALRYISLKEQWYWAEATSHTVR